MPSDEFKKARGMSGAIGKHIRAHSWVFSIIILVLLWQAVSLFFSIPAYLLPSPALTLTAVIGDASLLGGHLVTTMLETIAGLGLAIGLGLVVAVVMNASKLVGEMIYPPLVLSQAIPLIAIAPIILIWFGLGMFAKVLIVAFVCFFPIGVNTYEGFRNVNPELGELLDSFHASKWQRYRHLYIPATLPGILAGLKIAATYSVLGAVVGEWLGGTSGIGIYMTRALQSFRTDRLFGSIGIVMIMSFAIFKGVDRLGVYLTPWSKGRKND